MLNSLLTTTTSGDISFQSIIICTIASLIMGFGVALVYMYKSKYSKNFIITLALMPALIQLVIMMVNGNLGAGVAVMGAFSLVRFRSVPGTSREILSIFFAMALGLTTGMGYVGYAAIFFVIIGSVMIVLAGSKFGEKNEAEKELKITIAESLDYNGIFDDLFEKYTNSTELVRVRTTNMGSLYELQYHITIKDQTLEKEFIDEIRCRNGNLNITCGKVPMTREEL
ncbi:DUF4956 domain-containing protein [Konateibacter massiliensis]|uniref:DUF4956 domain-containing protein n=1 Tax=Konateibacter massiliensis TaxID=2002841 RepID=UPI001F2FA9DA|nr:DUF4956 domain-containing protein [Konateibacter massiliensis]